MQFTVDLDMRRIRPDFLTTAAFLVLVLHTRSNPISPSLSTLCNVHFCRHLQLSLPILRTLTLLSANGREFQKLSHTKLFEDTPLLNALDTCGYTKRRFYS